MSDQNQQRTSTPAAAAASVPAASAPAAPAPSSATRKAEPPRIPVRHLYFHDSISFEGTGYDTRSNIKCYKEQDNQAQHVQAEFIPAWQVFALTFHRPNAKPIERYLQASQVRSWTREDDR